MIRRIGVLTSRGDAPGMNADIRAVTRTAIHAGFEVLGIRKGFAGLISGDFIPLGAREVGGIISKGGTILKNARCPEFKNDSVKQQVVHHLKEQGIDAVVIIGGNGPQIGAYHLSQRGAPVIGIASTIDNDLSSGAAHPRRSTTFWPPALVMRPFMPLSKANGMYWSAFKKGTSQPHRLI